MGWKLKTSLHIDNRDLIITTLPGWHINFYKKIPHRVNALLSPKFRKSVNIKTIFSNCLFIANHRLWTSRNSMLSTILIKAIIMYEPGVFDVLQTIMFHRNDYAIQINSSFLNYAIRNKHNFVFKIIIMHFSCYFMLY